VVGEQHHLELARELEAGIRQMDAFTEGDGGPQGKGE
jgi:hypothetical protein